MMKLVIPLLFAFSAASATIVETHKTLDGDMKAIATAYEELGKQIDNKSKNKSSRRLTNRMIDASVAAQAKLPPGADKLEGQAKDDLIRKYQAEIQSMIDMLASLREALSKNDNAQARKLYEEMKPWTKPNHEPEFR